MDIEQQALQLQKQNVSALYAIAEALQKQEDRYTALDNETQIQKQAQELELEKAQSETATQDLVKSITKQIISELSKAENMVLNGDGVKNVSHKDVFEADGGDEDKQVAAKDKNDTGEVQKPIQAMIKTQVVNELKKHFTKEHESLYADDAADDLEEEVMEEPEEVAMDEAVEDVEPEGSSEYPMEEEEYDEDTFKMMKGLQKQLKSLEANIPNLVMKKAQEMSDAQLLKSGFRKEKSKQPQVTSLAMGLDADDYAISKSKEGSADFDINKVSFSDLYNAKMKRDSEGTDGLPQDLFRS
jgi:hypothetical protein